MALVGCLLGGTARAQEGVLNAPHRASTSTKTTQTPSVEDLTPGIEEITITGRRREEGLQKAPMAVTAVSGETLETRGASDISVLQRFTPNLTFDTTSPVSGLSSGAVVFIRGVGQTDFQLTTEPGVGLYVDGVYVSRSVGGVLDVLDLERVEVLRGPQGILFGRNTIGGAIQLISKKPGDELAFKGTITGGNRERFDLRASVDIPILEELRTRFSFSSKNQDGYVEGVFDRRALGNVNRNTGRALIVWEPTSRFSAELSVDGARIREQNAASRLVGISLAGPGETERTDIRYDRDTGGTRAETVPIPAGPPTLTWVANNVDGNTYDASVIPSGLDVTRATGPNGTELDIVGGSLTLSYDFGPVGLRSITALRRTSGFFNRDPDNSEFAVTHTENSEYEHNQFTQELQANMSLFQGRLKWVVGGFYLLETGRDFLDVTLPPAFGRLNVFTEIDNSSVAAYSQASFNIFGGLNVSAGLRYTQDNKDYFVPEEGGGIFNGPIENFGPAGTFTEFFPNGRNNTLKFNNLSWQVGADYQIGPDILAYLSLSTGFKSGGFNTRYLVPVPEVVTFDPEEVQNYEVGFKWKGLRNRLRTNIAGFYADYSDIQVVVYERGAPLNQNAGDARMFGAEAELTAAPRHDLLLSFALGFLDAKYTRIGPANPTVAADTQVRIDNELPNTPRWTIAAAADYTPFSETLNGQLVLHFDWSFKSDTQNDAINSPFLFQEAYHLFNASIGYERDDGRRWSVMLFVDNIADQRIIESGDSNFTIGFHEANFNRPRDWGARLSVDL